MDIELKYYEFFAGAGLVRQGLSDRWRCLWANDFDEKKAEVYARNFGRGHLHVGDVAAVEASDLPRGASMAWASFPCQDLSLAGWRRGMSAERSGTFWAFWRLLRDLYDDGDRPPVVVLENVAGLLYGDNFNGLCESLASLDYQFGAMLIDAKWFVPQSRPRVFVIGVDSRLDCSAYCDLSPRQGLWFPRPVLRAWENLPNELREHWRWWRLLEPTQRIASFESMLEEKPASVDWLSATEVERLIELMSPRNLEKVEKARRLGKRTIGFLYKRTRRHQQQAEVRFDGIAGCLRTPGGGSSRQTVFIVESDGSVKARLLSSREAARLMGAPEDYVLPSSYNDAYRAMGDAVVVPVIEWLSRHLLEPLTRAAERELDCRPSPAAWSSHRRSAEDLAAQWRESVT